jgi:hypothetical protein
MDTTMCIYSGDWQPSQVHMAAAIMMNEAMMFSWNKSQCRHWDSGEQCHPSSNKPYPNRQAAWPPRSKLQNMLPVPQRINLHT